MTLCAGLVRQGLVLGLAWASATLALASSEPVAALQAEVDALVQRGQSAPDVALQALTELGQRAPLPRLPALGRGLVAATQGRSADVDAALASLQGLAGDPVAAADAALVRAALADTQGATSAALQAAQAALQGYEQACPQRPDCDWRAHWQTLLLLARHDLRRGLHSAALQRAQAAVELARSAGDAARHAQALAVAADLSGLLGDSGAEQRGLTQALRMARLDGRPALRAQVALLETKSLRRRGDNAAALRSANTGLALARQAAVDRLVLLHLLNLSDALVASGDPRAALRITEEGLPLARRFGDRRTQHALLHNAALARIGLGQVAAARLAMEGLLTGFREAGASADEALALREFADAFAEAGQLPVALELYHRERALAERIMAANRDAALTELRQRFDREAQQRRLDQLSRESKLMSARLDNRSATQLVWAAAAVALVLAALLVALMYRRMRELNRRLAHNQAFLRAQSHRDPLTGLTNRRGLHETAAAGGQQARFEGALLLVDIDHFKRVNDDHGHAAGDRVLVEVARRLAEVVRADDLVVRWGGEEFLIFTPGVDGEQASALARRVLQAVGADAVMLDAEKGRPRTALRVTASVGYGCFPLAPARLPLSLERAINVADMALYTAKNQGRNCAIGVTAASAVDDTALRALEADFDQARADGRVTLQRHAGPLAPGAAAMRPPGAAITMA